MTIKSGRDSIKNLIVENAESERKITLILLIISENIKNIKDEDKIESIRILYLVFESLKKIEKYMSKILTIFQILINEENSKYLSIITEIMCNYFFDEGDIITKIFLNPNNENSDSSKIIFDLLLGFCIYNIKQDNKGGQICGCKCLKKLIDKASLLINDSCIKKIWEFLLSMIENTTFEPIIELMDSFIVLISSTESKFKPYSTITLFKILDLLTNSDWKRRKVAIDIIYTLASHFQEEIMPLKSNIIDFLKVVKRDKVNQVRDVCITTLKFLNDNEDVSSLESSRDFRSSFKITGNIGLINSLRNENEEISKQTNLFKINEESSSSRNPNQEILIKNTEDNMREYLDSNNLKLNNSINKSKNENSIILKEKKKIYKCQSLIEMKTHKKTVKNECNVYKNINNDEGIKKESKRDKSHSIFRTQANKNFFVKKGIKKNSGKFLIILDVEILFKGKTKDNQTNTEKNDLLNKEDKDFHLILEPNFDKNSIPLEGKINNNSVKKNHNYENDKIDYQGEEMKKFDIYKQIKILSEVYYIKYRNNLF